LQKFEMDPTTSYPLLQRLILYCLSYRAALQEGSLSITPSSFLS
jgi:hypothetical protein